MNDINWQEMLKRGHKQTKLQRIIGIIALAIILGFAMWHFFYASTPEYALNQLEKAIQTNDQALFEEYCNLDSITAKAYDDLTRDMFAHDSHLSNETKVMFERFYMKIKPQLITETNKLLLSYISSGKWNAPTNNNILKGRQLGIDYEYLVERSQLRNTTLIKVDNITRHNNDAIVKIIVRDKYTDTNYTLNLVMAKSDGSWKIVEIQNYRDYIDFLSPIQESGIKKYINDTSDITQKYNSILDAQQTRFKKLSKTSDGKLTTNNRSKLVSYIRSDIIPALEKRQEELNEFPVNDGAQYLALQRKESTRLSVAAWEHFITALETDSPEEFNISNAFHKDAMNIDHRIDDIIKNTAISTELPSTP
ncbi:MAG: DUF2939 domain-containing protein [Anaerovibrio sp.]|uniref:DUF2939 domain-containing protein n=1 Tax=Anaerovibrio sp. TaxID=1872532 RepID=UPI0025FD8F96|nr:DUF2939 domain-containing protein [Anaerovibrio sp.]MCR5175242.1 DUF2939 domain-containing protein [Anaerovibrio sp.]